MAESPLSFLQACRRRLLPCHQYGIASAGGALPPDAAGSCTLLSSFWIDLLYRVAMHICRHL